MVLYACADEKMLGGSPTPIADPRGRAARVLDDSGHPAVA
jgi:hypothetical protein